MSLAIGELQRMSDQIGQEGAQESKQEQDGQLKIRRAGGKESKSSFCESNTPSYDINTCLELMAHGYHWTRFPTFWSKEIGSHRPVIRVCHSILEDQA
jgi:hypothetical protein